MQNKLLVKKTILFFLFSVFTFFVSGKEIPKGYREIELGMSLDDTKDALLKDSTFGYHGDSDVSLVPGTNRILIETDAEKGHGSVFINRCWFQFYNDELYIITINVNPQKIDYYSIFTTLCKKYGEPDNFSPQAAVWKNDQYSMSLEKPLVLKYIDTEIFQKTQNYSNIDESPEEKTMEMFLDEL